MTTPLRIAYLTGLYARPSDTFIRQEVNQLRALGAEVATFSIRRPDPGPNPDADVVAHQRDTEYLLEAGMPRLVWNALWGTFRRPVAALRALRTAWRSRPPGLSGAIRQAVCYLEATRLASRLRAERIELLHNHIGENSATVAMLASELSGVPFSLTIHGPGIFYAPHYWALDEKLKRAAFTACISDYCRSQCQVFAPSEAWERLHVVRCAVPEAFLADAPDETIETTPPTFVCVGRLCSEKAQVLLVEAAKRLVDRGWSFRILLIGDGPERAAIEAAIKQNHLKGVVEVLGWRASHEIAEQLRTARALVSCSFAEGLPIVLMEAYALRRPVVATRIAANYELVEDDQTGWLIAPGCAETLTEALEAALDTTSETLRHYGDEGRRRVLERHHPQNQAKRLHELIRSAIDQPS